MNRGDAAMTVIIRPSTDEYAHYYEAYVNLVQEDNIVQLLESQLEIVVNLLRDLPEEKGLYRYADGKWSLKEVIGHISDTERIMSYRLLRVARGDATPLAGFDENDYVQGAFFDSSKLEDLLEDFSNVRRSTISLLRGLSEEALSRKGIANNSVISARALAYILVGHQMHHLTVIQERYLSHSSN